MEHYARHAQGTREGLPLEDHVSDLALMRETLRNLTSQTNRLLLDMRRHIVHQEHIEEVRNNARSMGANNATQRLEP